MNAERDAVLKSPAVAGRLAEDGVIAVVGTPQAFSKRTGIKLE